MGTSCVAAPTARCSRPPSARPTSGRALVADFPGRRFGGRVVFGARIPEEMAQGCGLRKFVERVNENGEVGVARKLARIVASDELAELVFRCRK